MSEPPLEEPIRLILGPDVLARAFTDDACRRMLFEWRDGRILPVVTRPLLRYYLRVLRGLGLSDRQLRRWVMWFTADSKVVHATTTEDETPPGMSAHMASTSKATGWTMVVTRLSRPSTLAGAISWQTPEELLARSSGLNSDVPPCVSSD